MRLKDVAQHARVSTSTVSRVLRHSTLVRSATRARVAEAIDTLRYNPNFYARSLAAGKSRSIGVIVSNVSNPFFMDIYKAIERGAQRAGYEVIIANTDHTPASLAASVGQMLGQRVAGLAVIVDEMAPDLIEELDRNRIPVVFYNFGSLRENSLIIRVDYRRGVERLIAHLYSLGHRRVGFVGHQSMSGCTKECMKLVLGSVPHYPGLRITTAVADDSLDGGRGAARALLTADASLTGLICATDWMAVGALRGLRESGLRVPTDISLAGFDNITLAQFCYPSLTSVHIPRDRIGQIICDFLITRDKKFRHEVFIDPELVVRDSTGLLSHA